MIEKKRNQNPPTTAINGRTAFLKCRRYGAKLRLFTRVFPQRHGWNKGVIVRKGRHFGVNFSFAGQVLPHYCAETGFASCERKAQTSTTVGRKAQKTAPLEPKISWFSLHSCRKQDFCVFFAFFVSSQIRAFSRSVENAGVAVHPLFFCFFQILQKIGHKPIIPWIWTPEDAEIDRFRLKNDFWMEILISGSKIDFDDIYFPRFWPFLFGKTLKKGSENLEIHQFREITNRNAPKRGPKVRDR